MCGIAGMHRRGDAMIPKVDKLADELLLAIQSRGRDAAGYLSLFDNGQVQLEKKTGPASVFVQSRGRIRKDARTVLLHTRYATVGKRGSVRNAHPVASGKVAAVHNGTVWNADAIFAEHGFPRIGEVDSEVIPALVNHEGWDQLEHSLSQLRGGAAIALVHTDHPLEVALARVRSYPLAYALTEGVAIWASTADAIETAWYRTYGKRLPAATVLMAEGEILTINGEVKTVAYLSPEIVAMPSGRPIPKAPTAPAPKGKRKKGHRGGKGMPRTIAPVDAQAASPGLRDWWEDDVLCAEVEVESTETDIRDLMANGLTRIEALSILEDAADWNEPVFVAAQQFRDTDGWIAKRSRSRPRRSTI